MTSGRRLVAAWSVWLTALLPLAASTGAGQDTLGLRGCLLLSRRPGVYALHMEYNRIAAIGHPDLANHVGRLVRLEGAFEEQGEQLRFVVESIEELAPTCESPASL